MSISHQARDAKPSLAIEVGTDEAYFNAIREEWETLERAIGNPSLFMTWRWQRLWWTHYGVGRQLRIFVARDGQRLLGVLPMYEEMRTSGPFRLCRLRTVGSGGDTAPDDLDALLHPDYAQEIAAEFARRLTLPRTPWNIVSCPDLTPHAPFAMAFLEASRTHSFALLRRSERSIICGPLPDKWDKYLHDLGAHRRKGLRRKFRKFEADGGVVVWHHGAEAVDAAFDNLARLHRMRWTGRTSEHAFSSEQYLAFHRALMHALDQQGALRLMELRIQGQPIAMRYGYRWGNTFFDLQSGFDPAFYEYSPGELCISFCVERAIGEGCSAFDMLRGDYEHKRAFFKTDRPSVDLTLYRGLVVIAAVHLKGLLSKMRAALSGAGWHGAENG